MIQDNNNHMIRDIDDMKGILWAFDVYDENGRMHTYAIHPFSLSKENFETWIDVSKEIENCNITDKTDKFIKKAIEEFAIELP